MIFIDNSQRPLMYAIYAVFLLTIVKHPHNRSVVEMRCDKSIH